ncbi:MAG TPA: BA14K family protein, partial [Xanthobacteraceae bacterium]
SGGGVRTAPYGDRGGIRAAGVASAANPGGGGGYRVSGGGEGWRGGYGRGYYRHRDRGFIPGAVAGGLIGGAIASQGYYDGYYDGGYGSYGYYGGPGYYASGYSGYDDPYYDDSAVVAAAPAPVGGDDVAYCMQTYRSYDPASGTYMGYDGLRHPCP